MLVFLIAMKGKAVARDWSAVSRLCERTLRSACNQTNGDFRVILSCSDLPETDYRHENLIILQNDYPAVVKGDRQSQSLDKVRKLSQASLRAHEFAPCHAMVLDADDLPSNRLAEFVARNPGDQSWRMDQGWVYREGSRFLWKHEDLSRICGSTHLLSCTAADLPAAASKGDLLLTAHIPHTEMTGELARRGKPVASLPFRGLVYSAAHGDNWSEGYVFERRSWRKHLRRLSQMRWLTAKVRREFGLQPV